MSKQSQHVYAVLLGLALCIGVVTSIVAAGLPAFLPMLFTPDRRLWPLMRTVAPQVLSLPMSGHGLVPRPGTWPQCLLALYGWICGGMLHDSWQHAHICGTVQEAVAISKAIVRSPG